MGRSGRPAAVGRPPGAATGAGAAELVAWHSCFVLPSGREAGWWRRGSCAGSSTEEAAPRLLNRGDEVQGSGWSSPVAK